MIRGVGAVADAPPDDARWNRRTYALLTAAWVAFIV
jgi:hypothetical protein